MTTAGMPGAYAANDAAADAWEDGRAKADRAHAFSEAYGRSFATEAQDVPVTLHTELEREAFRGGYATRAQDLADGSATNGENDVPWHKRTPAPGATYPPMGERQG